MAVLQLGLNIVGQLHPAEKKANETMTFKNKTEFMRKVKAAAAKKWHAISFMASGDKRMPNVMGKKFPYTAKGKAAAKKAAKKMAPAKKKK